MVKTWAFLRTSCKPRSFVQGLSCFSVSIIRLLILFSPQGYGLQSLPLEPVMLFTARTVIVYPSKMLLANRDNLTSQSYCIFCEERDTVLDTRSILLHIWMKLAL